MSNKKALKDIIKDAGKELPKPLTETKFKDKYSMGMYNGEYHAINRVLNIELAASDVVKIDVEKLQKIGCSKELCIFFEDCSRKPKTECCDFQDFIEAIAESGAVVFV